MKFTFFQQRESITLDSTRIECEAETLEEAIKMLNTLPENTWENKDEKIIVESDEDDYCVISDNIQVNPNNKYTVFFHDHKPIKEIGTRSTKTNQPIINNQKRRLL